MTDADRFRLLFGPYRTPCFQYGDTVFCEMRGEVTITGLSNGPIPWPMSRGKHGRPFFILFGGLANAVRRESGLAVAHWWGVTAQTVTVWRKALGVGCTNEGTSRLRSAYTQELLWVGLLFPTPGDFFVEHDFLPVRGVEVVDRFLGVKRPELSASLDFLVSFS